MKTNGTIYFSSVEFEVLDFIKRFINEHDYSPTFLEIGNHFNFSRQRSSKICSELYKMGLINKGGSPHRKIRMNPTQLKQVKGLKINREYSVHG